MTSVPPPATAAPETQRLTTSEQVAGRAPLPVEAGGGLLYRLSDAGCRSDRVSEAELRAEGYRPASERNRWGSRWFAKEMPA